MTIDGRLDGIEGKARFLASDEEDFLADARADGIDGNQRDGDPTRGGSRDVA